MALGQVIVNNQNLNQGTPSEPENIFLFIGQAPMSVGDIVAINTQTNFDKLFGEEESPLKTQLTAAFLNANSDWNALAVAIDDQLTWKAALKKVMQQDYLLEGVILCTPVIQGTELEAMHVEAIAILNEYQRRLFIMACSEGIKETETWADYLAAQRLLTKDISADRVLIVPQLHGNDQGVLAGRLANTKASIADSPMRVATGALVGLGKTPVDSTGEPLGMDTLTELDRVRFSVPQTYPDYKGMYWGDANMLAPETSDYQVLEYLRIVDKACRRIRMVLIPMIADRSVNNSPASMSNTVTMIGRPLREMARASIVGTRQMPGEIEPPKDGDIVAQFLTNIRFLVSVMIRPINCPKDIRADIYLDISYEV